MIRKYAIGVLMLVATAANASAEDAVLLQYKGIKITADETQHMVSLQVPPDMRAQFLADNQRLRQMISDLYLVRQFAVEAREAGLESDPLVKFQMDYQQDRVLMDRFLDKKIADAGKPDFESMALQAFRVNKEKYKMPERVRASHILIKTSENRSDEQAAALANELKERAVGGEDFVQLVAESSDDPSAEKNMGNLGYFEQGQMVKPFSEAAFALKNTGDISDVVKTQFGYHVIKLEDHRAAKVLGFDKVKAQLIEEEEKKFAADVRRNEISRVKSIKGIQVNQIAVSALSQDKEEQ